MRKTFFNNDKATLTVMVQAKTPERIKELIDKTNNCGAEAYGMQFEQLKKEYHTTEIFKNLFEYAANKPVYATMYRHTENEGLTDDELAKKLVTLAECGADLCDVMGDYFDRQPDELARDKNAVDKQKDLIDAIHANGASVLMSSHILTYTPPERVLEVALAHQERGADISKIVTGAETVEEELENLKIINMLKENLDIPFLFLCSGKCGLLRRIGGELGTCMYLCVAEHDEFATPAQPLLSDVKTIRDIIEI